MRGTRNPEAMGLLQLSLSFSKWVILDQGVTKHNKVEKAL